MGFIKEVIIYQRNETRVYINQCHAKGKRTKLFAIRKDDKTGLAHYLGGIRWHGAWRQYVFEPYGLYTIWNHGCLDGISAFLKQLNTKWRKEHQ